MPNLTPKLIENAEPKAQRFELHDSIAPGLKIVVQPSGEKSFAVRYKFQRKNRKYTLARVGAITLMVAREKARKVIADAMAGVDACEVKKFGSPADSTLHAAVELYDTQRIAGGNPPLRPRTAKYVRRELNDLKNAFIGRTVASITQGEIDKFCDRAFERGPAAKNTTIKVLQSFWRWAERRADMNVIKNPTLAVEKAKQKKRKRWLDDGELRLVWQAATEQNGAFGAITKILLLTGARRNEIAELRHSEIVGDWIILSPERVKTGSKTDEGHRIFITPLMRSILETMPKRSDFVFSTRTGKTAMGNNQRAKNSLDVRLNQAWTFHDLRRSFATGAVKKQVGVMPHIVEKCLNHALTGIMATYQHHDFSDEMREAWERWSRHIEKVVAQ